jgi:hypothetical protein
MRTPLKTAVSVLFCIDAFIWFIGVIPTLYYASTLLFPCPFCHNTTTLQH